MPLGADLESKVSWLRDPDHHPGGPDRVETVETHMAWVFLTDRYAYKLKKPVRYPYLDFRSPDARRRACLREVRLNRRLAPDVYLGVRRLTVDPEGRLALEGDGEVVDWLVWMRRLRSDRMLDAAVRRGGLKIDDVVPAARHLATFYTTAEPEPVDGASYVRRVRGVLADNRDELSGWSGTDARAPAELVERLDGWVLGNRGILEERARDGRIVEGHGDLRPDHVHLGPEPAVIDCIEFDRDLRVLDAVEELAFLAMECEDLGAAEVGAWFLEIYGRESGDVPDSRLVEFYKSHRALTRAKLAAWHLEDPTVPDPERWRRRTRRYLELAGVHASLL